MHDSKRKMKNGDSSYKTIMENIKKLCIQTNIKAVINTVLDIDNADCLIVMVKDLINYLGNYILCDNPQIVFNLGELCSTI